MTALTLYRLPRRFLRKLAKPILLRLNAWRQAGAQDECKRLRLLIESLGRAENREHRHKMKLELQRREIARW